MNIEQAILSTVNSSPGIKGVELVLRVMDLLNGHLNTAHYFHELERLVLKGQVIELEYILPGMSYRLKSLYFPAGTTLHVKETQTNAGHSSAAECLQGR